MLMRFLCPWPKLGNLTQDKIKTTYIFNEVMEKVDFLKMGMLFCILILQIVALCKAKRVHCTLCWFCFY